MNNYFFLQVEKDQLDLFFSSESFFIYPCFNSTFI